MRFPASLSAAAALLAFAVVAQQTEISQLSPTAVKIRGNFGESGNLSVEASTNLQSWEVVASTNGSSIEFVDANVTSFQSRFFRTRLAPDASVALQIVSPADQSVVFTNRPSIEVAYSGLTVNSSNLVLRHRGTNLPTRVNLTADRAAFELLSPLPEGFVTLYAAHLGTDAVADRLARVDLNIRTSANNLPPAAKPDFRTVATGSSVLVPVLANDRDPNGDILTVGAFTQGTNGAVTLENGSLRYTPAANFVGTDRFTYTASDPSGATATAEVRIAVTAPAGLIAYVVDEPALPNEFREVPEAVAYVCNASGQLGKVIVRTERRLTIGELRINCPVEITRDDDRFSSLAGDQITIISEANLTLGGMNIAGSGIVFDARASLNLFRMNFSGPTRILLRDNPIAALSALPTAAAGAAPQNLQIVNVTAPSVTTTIDTPGVVDADLEGIEARVVAVEGKVDLGSVKYKAIESEDVRVELSVGASGTVRGEGVVAASRHRTEVTVDGQAEIGLETVTSAYGEIDLKGAGRATVDVKNTQSQTSVRKFNGGDARYTSRDHTAFDADYVVGNENASANAHIDENGFRAGGRVSTTVGPGAKAEMALDVARVDGETIVTSEGNITGRYKNTEFNAGYRATINAGEASIDMREGKSRGVDIDAHAGVRLQNMIMEGMDFQADVNGNFREGAFLGVGGALNSDFSLGSRLRVILSSPPGGLPRKKAAVAQAVGASEFVVTNCTFNVSGNEAPINVFGLEIPVRIERNTIRASSFGIVAGEIAAPLTIRSNTLISCGIGVDGDIEGEGRAGYAPGPYLISRNTIREGNPTQGITLQDAKFATIEFNDIAATNGVIISAAYSQVVSNNLDASRNGASGLRALSGPNGPAAVVALGNTFTGAAPVTLLPDSYSQFVSNRFIRVVPQGSEDADAACVITVGNLQGFVSSAFRNNEFQDVTIAGLGPAFLEVSGSAGTFKEIGVGGLPTNARTVATIINNNTLSGDFPRISLEGVSLRMRGNQINNLDLGISGDFARTYAVVENNQFGGASNVSIGYNGFTRLSGNTFGADGFIGDGGFLVNNPGSNAINTENISSPLDFNGDPDNCADYPTPEFTDDPDFPCSNGTGDRPPPAPNIVEPIEPPWPAF